ncbi:hypothetical protein BCR42DRAFT_397302 [Absidia repens]|uniref:Uncharacterized protein n=1 Tax=Absidia repens TaxID=90262 RepID=A0A1X2I1J6_9FUNG|nr:hypothetical protein BCR42DRAFT_397302 [Absidia repens]
MSSSLSNALPAILFGNPFGINIFMPSISLLTAYGTLFFSFVRPHTPIWSIIPNGSNYWVPLSTPFGNPTGHIPSTVSQSAPPQCSPPFPPPFKLFNLLTHPLLLLDGLDGRGPSPLKPFSKNGV